MATFKKFEEIESWKMARELTKQFSKFLTERNSPETFPCEIKFGVPPSL